MRDIAVTMLVFLGLFYTLKKPYIGILLWSWLGYMNPHRLCYGFAYSMPFSQLTAIITVVAILFSKESKKIPKDALVYLLLLFIMWMGLTTFFAFEPEEAETQYIKIIKIQLPIFLTIILINSKERVNQLILVIVISLGYFGTKGGVFTLMTGGAFRVWGPPGSFVEENNSLAVASLMVIPLMVYLRKISPKKWQKQCLLFAIISMCFSVIGSQSRGAFLAIAIVGGYYWLQTDKKVVSGMAIVIFAVLVAGFLPESWYQRMDTMNTYEEDESAMGRIRAWQLAFNVANHSFFGGGLNLWSSTTYSQYLAGFDPLTHEAFVAHSIYFSVLGEHGWLGLILFLLIFIVAWLHCNTLIKNCADQANKQWIADLAKMLKVGFLAYLAGGAFLSLSYFDLPWHFVAIIIVLTEIEKNTHTPLVEQKVNTMNADNAKITISPQGFIQR
ncbi:MAG: putative O-glycosylation ligase, exosortase A system-associated [Methylococcaceae bacterium]|nr:putative O-glycosylation ligase, exosortase A system-associated [Methylococcaceae bacterium]